METRDQKQGRNDVMRDFKMCEVSGVKNLHWRAGLSWYICIYIYIYVYICLDMYIYIYIDIDI